MPPDPLFPQMLMMAPAGDQPTTEPGRSPVELFQATIESGLKILPSEIKVGATAKSTESVGWISIS